MRKFVCSRVCEIESERASMLKVCCETKVLIYSNFNLECQLYVIRFLLLIIILRVLVLLFLYRDL